MKKPLADKEKNLAKEYAYDASALVMSIGTVAVSFGRCQESVLRVFWRLTDMPYESASAVFNTLKSDTAQRDITEALAVTRLTENDPILVEIRLAMRNLSTYSSERNAAVHTIWEINPEGLMAPSQWILRHHGKLKAEFCLKQFQTLAMHLTNEQMALNRAFIALSEMSSFPHAERVQIQQTKTNDQKE